MTPVSKNEYSPIGREYRNPPNAKILRLIAVLSLYVVLLGIVVFAITGSLLILIIAIVLGSVQYFSFWWRENVHKPSVIRIENEGLALSNRNRPTEQIDWDMVMMVNIKSMEPTGLLGIPPGCTVRLKGRLAWIPVTYELADAVRHGYYTNKGTYPPNLYVLRNQRHR